MKPCLVRLLVHGVLSEAGALFYATVRKPEVEQMTHNWLYEQGFPCPGQVVLCQSVGQKPLALSQYDGRLVFVDDRWRQLREVWPRLVEHEPAATASLLERLTLVAFGASAADLPTSSLVPVVPLPEWSLVADALTTICGSSGKDDCLCLQLLPLSIPLLL